MTAISNNLLSKDYLDQGTTTSRKRTANNDKIIDDQIKPLNITYDVKIGKLRGRVKKTSKLERPLEQISVTFPARAHPELLTASLIYAIVRREGERKHREYIGKSDAIYGRMSKWNYDFNNPNSDRYNCKLSRAIRKNPNDFFVKIIESCSPEMLNERETFHKKELERKGIAVFNKINGGGGGAKRRRTEKEPDDLEVPKVFESPKKMHSLVYENGVWIPKISPGSRKQKNVIYAIRHKIKKVGYFGETTGQYGSRISNHIQKLNNPNSSSTSGIGILRKEMQASPDKYAVAIYDKFEDEEDAGAYERAIIKSKREDKNWKVTNVTSGNNGPGPSPKPVSRKLSFGERAVLLPDDDEDDSGPEEISDLDFQSTDNKDSGPQETEELDFINDDISDLFDLVPTEG